jgi:exodeoxyribonuclease V gamma subunit
MFHLHRAERTDTLADALADLLIVPPADPMASEVVAVPAPGVERWLQQRLATRLGATDRGHDGIAANLAFDSPALLTDRVLADAMAFDAGHVAPRVHGRSTAGDRWRPTAMTWPVLQVLDRMIDDPRLAVLARHVGAGTSDDDHRRGRRYATARQIAGLFDTYARARPTMLSDWATGDDTDGAGSVVAADLAWQPEVWRAVRELIGEPNPAEYLARACVVLRESPTAGGLPDRLSVFGPTRITESLLQVLGALAVHRDVHLFVPHPSPALWAAIETAEAAGTDGRRRSAHRPPALEHPLLAGLSRDVQEMQRRVAPVADRVVHHSASPVTTPTVLSALQAGIRDDTVAAGTVPADASVEVHSCHGSERQVDVLRDRLLHLFAADPTLQPRDVLIMCPDVETFAPLIRGAFGQPGLGHPAFELRVRLADRGLRHTNAVLDVVAAVVELAAGRVSAGAVLDLLLRTPVRERFDLTDDDIDMIREWLVGSNIRWAIDDTQRSRFGLAGFGQGTFDAGLDRILLGAVAEEADGEWLDTALPLAGVESTEIDLAGRFAEFVARLSGALAAMSGAHSSATWVEVLVGVVDALTRTGPDDEWQRAQAVRSIASVFDTHGPHDEPLVLRLGDIRDLIAGLVAATPTRANFRTGELTVCSMVPMRSVPHRVIVLLGVDADAFPRATRTDGDDILGRSPLIGERNPRDEDRQLFLDAICAAQENLMLFYSGADPVSGQRIPPAVVVSELIDAVHTLTGSDGADASSCLRQHTLHAFDERNFRPGVLAGVNGPFSFDEALLAGARVVGTAGSDTPRIADIRLPRSEPEDIDLESLISFLTNPIEGFVRQRLGARVPAEERPHADQLDVHLAALDKWGIGDRFLSRMLSGSDLAACQAAELRRGTLPPFAFGTRELQDISVDVDAVFAAAAAARTGSPSTADVVVPLPDGRRLYGTVSDIFSGTIVTATYSKLRAKQRLVAWIRLLAVAATAQTGGAAPVRSAAVVARRPRRGGGDARSLFAVPDDPLQILTGLVAVLDIGLTRALPLPLDPAAEFADHHLRTGRVDRALPAARKSFEGDFGAGADRYLRLVYTGDVTSPVDFDALLAESIPDGSIAAAGQWAPPTLPGEVGDPLFTGLARLIWGPLMDHETLS